MPFEKDARRLAEIIENADAIARYTLSTDRDGLKADAMRRDAVERCLERISEAASRLGPRAAALVPGQPWEQIRALGNRLRHEYDRIRIDRCGKLSNASFRRYAAPAPTRSSVSSDRVIHDTLPIGRTRLQAAGPIATTTVLARAVPSPATVRSPT